jgi:hypothetical protein
MIHESIRIRTNIALLVELIDFCGSICQTRTWARGCRRLADAVIGRSWQDAARA